MKVGIEDRVEKEDAHHRVDLVAACPAVVLDRCLLALLLPSAADADAMLLRSETDTDTDTRRASEEDESSAGNGGGRAGVRLDARLEAIVAHDERRVPLWEDTLLACASMAWGLRPVTRADLARRAVRALEARATLARLLRAPGIPQRTPEWYEARMGMITASDMAQALGAGKFGTQRAFFQKKCGAPEEQSAFDGTLSPLKWGSMYEPMAQAAYSALNCGVQIHEFGLLRHPDPALDFVGASPDGVSALGVMLEIKCPWRRSIVPGEVPTQYYYQIQAQLAVTGLTECDYFECEFRESDSFQDWVVDSGGDGSGSILRGAVVEVPAPVPSATVSAVSAVSAVADASKEAPRYVYPPPELLASPWGTAESDAAWAAWVAAQVERETEEPIVHWWTLVRHACTRVTYDPVFTADMMTRLRTVWDHVLRYRRDRELYVTEVGAATATSYKPVAAVTAVAAARVQVQVSMSTYAFLDDSLF